MKHMKHIFIIAIVAIIASCTPETVDVVDVDVDTRSTVTDYSANAIQNLGDQYDILELKSITAGGTVYTHDVIINSGGVLDHDYVAEAVQDAIIARYGDCVEVDNTVGFTGQFLSYVGCLSMDMNRAVSVSFRARKSGTSSWYVWGEGYDQSESCSTTTRWLGHAPCQSFPPPPPGPQ